MSLLLLFQSSLPLSEPTPPLTFPMGGRGAPGVDPTVGRGATVAVLQGGAGSITGPNRRGGFLLTPIWDEETS